MKQFLTILLLISLIISMVGCNFIYDDNKSSDLPKDDTIDIGEQNESNKNDQVNDQEKEKNWFNSDPWNGIRLRAFDSYESLMAAWRIINENSEKEADEYYHYYILPDDLGDDYTVIYKLETSVACTDMSKQTGVSTSVQLFIHGTSRDMCEHTPDDIEYYAHGVTLLPNDEDLHKYDHLDDVLSVQILTHNYVKIEDRSLLTIKRGNNSLYLGNIWIFDQPIDYDVFYGDTHIAYLDSCIELDDEVLELIINNLCGVYDLSSENPGD